jgi:demethoxyubiquinone hydroxylase (CLK1/Coq7/Cat5 family)
MKNNNCSVCGLSEKVCLHSIEKQESKIEKRVTAMFWATIGFLLGIGSGLIVIIDICAS